MVDIIYAGRDWGSAAKAMITLTWGIKKHHFTFLRASDDKKRRRSIRAAVRT